MLSSSSFKLLSSGTTLAQELPGIEPPSVSLADQAGFAAHGARFALAALDLLQRWSPAEELVSHPAGRLAVEQRGHGLEVGAPAGSPHDRSS